MTVVTAAPVASSVGRIDTVVVLDFGSQTAQLIARRVRECHVYCELLPHDVPWERVQALQPSGIILSGGPASVYEAGAPQLPAWVLQSGLPVLGICYGMQLLAHAHGGQVVPGARREYGPAHVRVESRHALFHALGETLDVWMNHGDHVQTAPAGFRELAHSTNGILAAMARDGLVGLQFHPEVAHTPMGTAVIRNFLYGPCGLRGNWTAGSFVDMATAEIRRQVGDGKVLLALSGGVDSSVAAALLQRAVGERLICVFVDNGLLRLGEAEQVVDVFQRHFHLNLVTVDARDRFLEKLSGVTDPERKRKIIGTEFVRIFEEEARKVGQFDFLAQGTLYPDVIESTTAETKATDRIKTHHNVGGLPADMTFKLVEPLRWLFKDEVRAAGLQLGLPEEIVYRQPFPGPGLAVRCIGAITDERLAILRKADAVVREEIDHSPMARDVWQYFAVLLPVHSVGIMGDGRSYAQVVAVRAVASADAMTADWARLPHDLLARISSRIVNEVPGVNRVVYDISSKPPATIEWE